MRLVAHILMLAVIAFKMRTYIIDKSKFDNFLVGRRIIQLAIVLTLGVMFLRSNLKYDTSGMTTANIIWYYVFAVFYYSVLIGILLILKKFNAVMRIFFSWDVGTKVMINNERMEIDRNDKSLVFALNELTIENFKFYGWYMNPLYGLGYVVITTPTEQTIILSSILFDLGYGVDKADSLFKSRVKKYSKHTISWFSQLPPTMHINHAGRV